MLQQLSIRNYILIERLDFAPVAGLSMITGETGAGKSILLGALGLMAGERAEAGILLNTQEKCTIEGTFDLRKLSLEYFFQEHELEYDPICIIRREIHPNGKSRAFINDGPVTLDILRKLANQLLDIHSQHDHLYLADVKYQTSIVDAFAQHLDVLKAYQTIYKQWVETSSELETMLHEDAQSKQSLELEQFLFEELEQAQLQVNEQEEHEQALNLLENAEQIKVLLRQWIEGTGEGEYAALQSLYVSMSVLDQLQAYGSAFLGLKERLRSVVAEVKDMVHEAEKMELLTELDPEKLFETRERLTLIYRLQKKHKCTDIASLLKIQDDLGLKVQKVQSYGQTIQSLKENIEKLYEQVIHLGQTLHQGRKQASELIAAKVQEQLSDLGMPLALFKFQLIETKPSISGTDQIKILFAANPGLPAQDLKQAASGGEFSRLSFALKQVMATQMQLPTLILDEIDTGISGEIALKMGQMMKSMAQKHQLITITHLPQVAAKAEAHFWVYKKSDGTQTRTALRQLTEDERLRALAQMISGQQVSANALASAKELMEN